MAAELLAIDRLDPPPAGTRRDTGNEDRRLDPQALSQISGWRAQVDQVLALTYGYQGGLGRRMTEGGKMLVQADDSGVASPELRALEKRMREHGRVLGRKTAENEILR